MTPGATVTQEAGTVRQYSVSGITSDTVAIQLFECDNLVVDSDGVATFTGTNPGGAGNVAVVQTVNSAITVVNGSTTFNQWAVTPQNGTVTFSVQTSGADDCFVPVVYDDANNNQRLNLAADGRPTEAFGVGGFTNVVPAEATQGAKAGPLNITRVDLDNNLFVAGGATYYYDSNDTFQIRNAADTACVAVSMAAFEAALSVDDQLVDSFYNTAEAASSTLCIRDIAPFAPDNVEVQAPTGTRAAGGGLEVWFDDSDTDTVASYQIFRATVQAPTVIGAPAPGCPDPTTQAGQYTQVGTVTDTNPATGEYVFHDTTAQPPAAGETYPRYCYFVRSVDRTGDTGPASDTAGPLAGERPSTIAAMRFVDADVTSTTTIEVEYNLDVNAATVAANGSDFRVTATQGGIATNVPVTSAAVDDDDDDVVVITTTSTIPAGTITVTSQVGTDGNTVCAAGGTTNCQPAGQTVQATRDTTAPTSGATFRNAPNNQAAVTWSEDVVLLNASGIQLFTDAGCTAGALSGTGPDLNANGAITGVAMAGDVTTSHNWIRIAAGTVRDAHFNQNAAVACAPVANLED